MTDATTQERTAERPPEAHFAVKTEMHGPGVFPQHAHDGFEALLILSGRRIQHIGLHDVVADQGSLLFIPPGVLHGATLQGDSVSLMFSFSLSFLHPELGTEAARAWDRPATLDSAPELLPFLAQPNLDFTCDPRLWIRLREMGAELMARSGTQVLGVGAYARAQLSILLLDVVQAFEGQLLEVVQAHRPAANSECIDDLLAFLRDRLADPISIEDAARHLHVSSSCLAARVRRLTGKSFSELLGEARLLRAKELLIYSDQRISEIAFACGFEDHAYFSRRFRLWLGAAPVDYRKRHSLRPTSH